MVSGDGDGDGALQIPSDGDGDRGDMIARQATGDGMHRLSRVCMLPFSLDLPFPARATPIASPAPTLLASLTSIELIGISSQRSARGRRRRCLCVFGLIQKREKEKKNHEGRWKGRIVRGAAAEMEVGGR
ncbi:unnamed protein product [Linum trigynum]|uniref:Uncharacterized protein n=1 Tax=Linum trigynum TaxID=586398 RepID=A0AAV2D5R2_9ROSI